MGETDSYYDWERKLDLSVGKSTHKTRASEFTKIGISRKLLKAHLKEWKKDNPLG